MKENTTIRLDGDRSYPVESLGKIVALDVYGMASPFDPQVVALVEVLVDADKIEVLGQDRWIIDENGYAVTKGNRRMHREIAGAQKGDVVDHIDGNRLNNRRDNLRICTHRQNSRNSGKQKNNTSGYKGVHLHADTKRWAVTLGFERKTRYLGMYDTPEEAARRYDSAAWHFFGEFARLNFPTETPAPYAPLTKSESSAYRGVYFDAGEGKWAANINVNRKQKRLGRFDTEVEAAKAYNAAVIAYGLDPVRLNKIKEETI